MKPSDDSTTTVKIQDDFWTLRIDNIARHVLPYQWRILNDSEPGAEPSHSMENFKIAAGLSDGEYMGFKFQDSDAAKWLQAAAYSLQYFDSKETRREIDEAVETIRKAQQPNGYLQTYFTIKEPDQKWKQISQGHELYCAGHLLEAAVALHTCAGDDRLLNIMEKCIDNIINVFGKEEGKLDSYPGHEEIELALMAAYHATKDEKYFTLAEYFIENRGTLPGFSQEEIFLKFKADSRFSRLDYHQAHAKIRDQKTAEGHAVRAMYFYSGAADLARETGDSTLVSALETLWNSVSNRRMYVTGGIGSQHDYERFTIDYDLPNDTAYNETCASIGLAMWAYRMLKLSPRAAYADVMERTLYNGVLSGISFDGERYFYVNPLYVKPDIARYREDHKAVKTERVKWFGCACCPPNVARTVLSIGNYVYTHTDEGLYMHLYAGNHSQFTFDGKSAELTAITEMPWNGKTKISIAGDAAFCLNLRIPEYSEGFSLCLNGENIAFTEKNGYAQVNRKVTGGDVLEICFDLPVRLLAANPRVDEDCGRLAVQRGPLIYCAEQTDNFPLLSDFRLDPSQPATASHSNLFGGIVTLTVSGKKTADEAWNEDTLYRSYDFGKSEQKVKLHMIPYYLWNNRGEGEMLVWLRY